MSTTMLKSSCSALHITGKFDIIGEAVCKLANEFSTDQMIASMSSMIESNEASKMLHEDQIAGVRAALVAFNNKVEMFEPILGCLRELRDSIANANGIPPESQYRTAAFQAEEFEFQLMQDDQPAK